MEIFLTFPVLPALRWIRTSAGADVSITCRQAELEVEMLPVRRAAVARWWGEGGEDSQERMEVQRGQPWLGDRTRGRTVG